MIAELSLGMGTIALIGVVLIYVKKVKSRMRKSVLRFERIQDKLED